MGLSLRPTEGEILPKNYMDTQHDGLDNCISGFKYGVILGICVKYAKGFYCGLEV